MDRTIRLISSILTCTICFPCVTAAQNKHWSEIRNRPLVKFDWNCASPSAYPERKLERLVRTVLRREQVEEGLRDRAFAFDLNDDGRPEYFVPLVRGGTGNCTWGLFALGPARFLGTISGQYLYVHKRTGYWPTILAYGHMTAAEGTLYTYIFRNGRYAQVGKGYGIGPEGDMLEVQNLPGHRMPKFLDSAQAACKTD